MVNNLKKQIVNNSPRASLLGAFRILGKSFWRKLQTLYKPVEKFLEKFEMFRNRKFQEDIHRLPPNTLNSHISNSEPSESFLGRFRGFPRVQYQEL